MKETTLYQISESTGKGKIWMIRVDDKGSLSEITVRSGAFNFNTGLHGNLITNISIVEQGKNIGKSNQTTHYTQAVSEAQSKIKLKLKDGYVYDPDKVKTSAILGSGIPKPMLAHKYHPSGKQASSKTLKQMKIDGSEIVVQPKLDGNRCLIRVNKEEAVMYTRKGDVMPVQLSHITTEIINSFSQLNTGDELVLDGELYCDPSIMSFNTLNGLLKRQSATSQQEQQRSLIKMHLYDVMSSDGYMKRFETIKKFASSNVQVIESKKIIATDSNIQKELERYLELGYEGLMIRVLDKGYEHKRSWQLVKCKLFEDSEFKLVGFEEDVRKGFVGTFILELPKPVADRDGKVVTTFRAGASGQSVADRTYMLLHPEEFIGKMTTVEYFGWDIRPRFPKFKSIREE